jgi:hypothetical protein
VTESLHAWLDAHLPQAETLNDGVDFRLGARVLRVSGSAETVQQLTDLAPLDRLDRPDSSHTHLPRVSLHYLDDAAIADLPNTRHLRRGPYGAITAWANDGGGYGANVFASANGDGNTDASPWLICLEDDLSAMLAFHVESRQALAFWRTALAPRQIAEFARTLMHWAAIADGNVLVHAAAVAREGRGLLICGVGTSGKTTLVRQCIAEGWTFLADNVVEYSPATSPDASAAQLWSTYATLKLRRDAMPVSPPETSISQWDDEAEKDIHFLLGTTRAQFASKPVTHVATLVLQPGGPAQPEPLAAGAGLLAIAPNTVAQFPFYEREVLERISALTRSAPLFTAGRMPLDAMTRILEKMMS